MIHPESEKKIEQESVELPSDDVPIKEVKIKASIRGFLVNIFLALFWWAVFGLTDILLTDVDNALGKFLAFLQFSSALLLSSFHVYVLFKPSYEYAEEHEELRIPDVFKKRWALMYGTAIFFLAFNTSFFMSLAQNIQDQMEMAQNIQEQVDQGINNQKFNSEDVLGGMLVLLFINVVAAMNCWGFITNNRKNFFARIVRPWQVYDDPAETEAEKV